MVCTINGGKCDGGIAIIRGSYRGSSAADNNDDDDDVIIGIYVAGWDGPADGNATYNGGICDGGAMMCCDENDEGDGGGGSITAGGNDCCDIGTPIIDGVPRSITRIGDRE